MEHDSGMQGQKVKATIMKINVMHVQTLICLDAKNNVKPLHNKQHANKMKQITDHEQVT